MKNLIIAHGGAPTSVINASLYGAIKELKENGFEGKIYAPKYGSDGLFNEDFIDLTDISEKELEILRTTPGSAIGSSRFPLYEKEYKYIVNVLRKYDIGYVLFTGGNGTMDTIGNIYKYAKEDGLDVTCVGIPKTIDNDIGVTDHAPGFPSCANYIIQTVLNCAQDVKGLPIHVVVIEVMGRNAGWLAASSVLARKKSQDAPHLIYFPEIPFDEEEFLKDVKEKWDEKHGVVIVASEGLKDKNGNPIVQPVFKTDRATYYGDVGAHLANLIIQKLGIKARSEKPGIICRCDRSLASKIDLDEAELMGRTAIKAALNNTNGVMAGIKRISTSPYKIEPILIPIESVMLTESKFPLEYIKDKHDVSDEFLKWLEPLVEEIPENISFLD